MPHRVRFVEESAKPPSRVPDLCCDCLYYGEVVKMSKHLGKELVEVHSCTKHEGCMNTKYSICCDDFDAG